MTLITRADWDCFASFSCRIKRYIYVNTVDLPEFTGVTRGLFPAEYRSYNTDTFITDFLLKSMLFTQITLF